MKRFLAFLALFALGLLVLLWIQSRSDRARGPEPAAPASSTRAQGGEQLTEFTDSKGQSGAADFSGPLDARYRPPETGRLRYQLTARDVSLVGEGLFELPGFRLLFYDDRGDGALESEATATRARGKLNTALFDQSPLDESFPVTLYEAVATLHKGSRFSPVTLKVPELSGLFSTRKFDSRDLVEVAGRGLTATGRGLELDGQRESLRLLENPSATVEFENGTLARLASRGAFSVESRPDLGPNTVEVTAREGAELTLEGPRKLHLTADVVRLFGEIESGLTERFVPQRAEAEGRVVIEPGEGVFAGARAELEFEGGEPVHAALDGEPKLDLVLRGESLQQVPPELLVEGETLTVALRGAGPLELFLGAEERFQFNGPATLELPALADQLSATSSIGGSLGPDGGFHELTAFGAAKFDHQGARFEAEDILVRSFLDSSGRAAARLIGVGSTHAAGALADGRTFDLLARRGLIAERTGAALRVPSAEDVDLRVLGPDGFFASADHVGNVDLEALTLFAEGQVEFESERGRGRGARLDVLGPSRGELAGDDQRPARFELDLGWFEARHIAFDGTRIHARIDAHALANVGGTLHDVQARWVVIERYAREPEPNQAVEGGVVAPGVVLLAGGDVKSTLTNASESWRLSADELRAFADESRDESGRTKLEPTALFARGAVDFDYLGPQADLHGRGERLEVSRERRGRLFSAPGGKVELAGLIPGSELEFEMAADEAEFAPASLGAVGFDATVQGLDLPWHARDAPAETRSVRAVGARLSVDQGGLFLTDAYLGGATATQGDWAFDAPFVMLTASPRIAEPDAEPLGAVHDVVAWGGFTADLGAMGSARGESIQLANTRRTATITGSPAVLARPELSWSSSWFDVDMATGFLRADSGEVSSTGDAGGLPWRLRYASLEPVVTPDETIQVMREPVMTQAETEVRAGWAVLWLDRGEWNKLSGAASGEADPNAPRPQVVRKPASLFDRTGFGEMGRWLREVYLEGEIEFRVLGDRRARAEAAYFDLVEGIGWLRDIDLTLEMPLNNRDDTMKVQADWLRHSIDGTLQAVNAVVTTCSFDEPHYVIKIGDFSMLPRWKEEVLPPEAPGEEPRVIQKHDGWSFALENNVISSPGGFEIPMPRVAFPTDRQFEVDRDALEVANIAFPQFGQDSKYGTFIGTSFTRDLGWVAQKVHGLVNRVFRTSFGMPDLPKISGHTTTTASYFGSRGGRVGTESSIDSPGQYHFDILFDAIYDRGEDRGLVRVPASDRDRLRTWLRTRGRILLDEHEWIDAVLTWQGDPGVQSEFFEDDYLEYETRESYLHYRRAKGERQWHATVEGSLEDFRTEVVDQPSLGYFRGRSQIGWLARQPLIYASDTTLEQLRRFEGDPAYEPPFPDGLGERDLTRFDTTQSLETPVSLAFAGLRATPFVAARATAWSDNAAETDAAGRAALLAGAEVATTFWKLFESGSRHSWSPSIGYRTDVASSDSNLPVAQFDALDASLEGEFMDLAVRSRWEYREQRSDLDLELRQTYANDLPAGQVEGWQPFQVRGSWLSRVFGMPFGVTHDARYDLDHGETDYSRTFFGWEPRPDLDLETGLHNARDLAGDRLYNAISLGARYALSSKWEVDGDYTFSISDNGDRLGSSMTLRRIGHDFVFEVESSFVAGEGSSSLRFNIAPLLTWRPYRKGMLDRWRALRN